MFLSRSALWCLRTSFLFGLTLAGWTGLEGQDLSEGAKQNALKWIDEHQGRIVELSDTIWKYAEPPFEEFQTYQLLTDELRKAGFKIQEHVVGMPTAFVASYSQGSGKPVIGIVAEYDALPGLSQRAAVPYKSPLVPGGPGHGCGHNLIGASSAAAAIAVKEAMVRAGVSGTIKFFGAPSEEEYIPKVYMADAGLFNDVDAALAWHPGSNFEARYGTNRALNSVKFVFTGKSRTEALKAVLKFQEKTGLERGVIRAGDLPTVEGTSAEIRAFVQEATRQEADQKVEELRALATKIASETGTEAQTHFIIGTYQRLTHEGLVRLVDRNMRLFAPVRYTAEELEFAKKIKASFPSTRGSEKLLPDQVLTPSHEIGGSNDNGDVSWITPFISFRGGAYVMGQPGHSWQNASIAASSIGHKAMLAMTKTLSVSALDLMTRQDLLAEVRKEFQEKTKGFVYRANIPKERNSLILLGKATSPQK
ncbi:MAG: amidohydrolase [Acidobacteria bacterium]|nr:amidohydrolase [Acidobacteriota bacterium]